jgi:hypothetical protein
MKTYTTNDISTCSKKDGILRKRKDEENENEHTSTTTPDKNTGD